jgi:hypothetical protein
MQTHGLRWRGPEMIRAMFDVEPLDEDLAKIAGEAVVARYSVRRSFCG